MNRRKMTFKRIWAFLMACFFGLGLALGTPAPVMARDASNSVVLSVERFALGKGWVTVPDVVPLQSGDTVSALLERYMEDQGYPCIVTKDNSYGWYLEGISDADGDGLPLRVPQVIKDKAKKDGYKLDDSLVNEYKPNLTEFSYSDENAGTTTSGWMYSVNETFPGYSMNGYKLQAGDVVRIQFSLYGTGLDIEGTNAYGSIYKKADKSELLKKIAYINQDTDSWLQGEEEKEAYKTALTVMQKLNASQSEVDSALKNLPQTQTVWPERVVLSSNDLTLYDNDPAVQLTADIYPEETLFKKVVWSTSDESIASVDNKGNVTPHTPGETDITATTQNGVSASCKVTVTARPFTAIALDKTALFFEAEQTYQLNVTGTPSNATEALCLEWSSSDDNVAVVSQEGLVTAVSTGNAVITVVKSGTQIAASCQVTVGNAMEMAEAAAALVEELPKAGDLTIQDAAQVAEAFGAFQSLSEEAKSYLEHRTELEQKLDRCVSMMGTLQEKYANVYTAEGLIGQIPSLSALNIDSRKSVEDAQAAYEGLKAEEKALIDTSLKNKLDSAVKRMRELEAQVHTVNSILASLPGNLTLDEAALIRQAAEEYHMLDDAQKGQLFEGAEDQLTWALSALSRLITDAAQIMDITTEVDLESAETENFLKAADAYDECKDLLSIEESTAEKIGEVKNRIGSSIHSHNGVNADSYWYIKTNAEITKDTQKAEKAISKKYKNAEKPQAAWNLSYTDIRDGKSYEQEKNITLTFTVNKLSSMENPILFSYQNGNLKKCKAEINSRKDTISTKVKASGLYLVVDVPIPLTGLSLENQIQITKGNSKTLNPEKIPSDATSKVDYEWKSSDPSIVAVDGNGVITAKKEGTAAVSASVKDKSSVKATVKVKVITKANALSRPLAEVLSETQEYVLKVDKSPTIGSEWYVIALARNGSNLEDSYFSTYYNHLANYIVEKKGKLTDTKKYSEYSKTILTVTAIGKDARDVAGYNLLEYLADFDKVTSQGRNGPIWALIALNCHPDYTIPEVSGISNRTTEQKLIDYIVDAQVKDGGWTLTGKIADSDMTGMALQALAPYYKKDGYDKVTKAIDKALDNLGSMQLSSGGFATMNVETSESGAQILTALSALGIDPQTDPRFIKNGKWLVENMISYHIKDSGFMHVKAGAENNGGAEPGTVDGLATGQGFYSLVAYRRFLDKKTSLYDMSDLVVEPGGTGDGKGTGLQEEVSSESGSVSSKQTGGTQSSTSKTADGSGKKKADSGSTAKKKTEGSDSKKGKEEVPWSFNGDTYEPETGSDAGTTAAHDAAEAAAGAGGSESRQGLAKVFNKNTLPYILCIACGASLIGVCVYFKKNN